MLTRVLTEAISLLDRGVSRCGRYCCEGQPLLQKEMKRGRNGDRKACWWRGIVWGRKVERGAGATQGGLLVPAAPLWITGACSAEFPSQLP